MSRWNREAKEASKQTIEYQKAFAKKMGIDIAHANNEEVELAKSHSMELVPDKVIQDDKGNDVWNLKDYGFLKEEEVPYTINPSLWLNAKANFQAGLFWVVKDKIFQVRGFDLANITFVRTKNGFLVLDTGSFVESVKAALELAERGLGEDIRNHIKAVIISHSHADHYGGVAGIVSEDQVGEPSEGKIPIYVPEGFDKETVSESIYAGNAMIRRAKYQFAHGKKPGVRSVVSAGLGLSGNRGTGSYIAPTYEIKENQTLVIDGLEVEFQLTPGTEAPAEMNNYFPEYRAFWAAENCTATLHNFYPIRGAKVRDSSIWSDFTIEALEKYGDKTDVVFQSHHWPHWNTEKKPDEVKNYLKNSAAIYKYIHDQALLLANKGYTPNQIAHEITIPKRLEEAWYIRPYYGTVEVNAKAVYQRYLGYYNANPVTLHPLTEVETAKKFVEYVGSEEQVLEKAEKDLEKGNYQWAAQAANYVAFANPQNEKARLLCADALEQLGYQAESSIWRNAYLVGAEELRYGVPEKDRSGVARNKYGILEQTTARRALGYLGIVIDGEKAAQEDLKFRLDITDTDEHFTLYLYAGTLLIYDGVSEKKLPTVRAPKKIVSALVTKTLDSIRNDIETDIYDDLKRIESYVVDLSKYAQFGIVF